MLLNALSLYDEKTFDTSLGILAQSFIEFIDILTRDFPPDRSVFFKFFFFVLQS